MSHSSTCRSSRFYIRWDFTLLRRFITLCTPVIFIDFLADESGVSSITPSRQGFIGPSRCLGTGIEWNYGS